MDDPDRGKTASSILPNSYQPLGWFRLLLAFMVLLTHFSQNIASPAMRDAIFPLCVALVGVSCFFVLSGFIIAEAIETFYVRRPAAFIINRLLRIIPPLVAALIFANVLYAIIAAYGHLSLFHSMDQTGHRSFGIKNISRNFVSLLPLPKNRCIADVDTLPVLWTLRIELMFYIFMFGAAFTAAGMAHLRICTYQSAMRITLVAAALLCLAGFAAWAGGKAPPLLSYFAWFGLGVSFFFASKGRPAAWLFTGIFLAAAIWQFVAVEVAGRAAYQMNPLLRGQPVSPYIPLAILICCLAIIAAVPYLRVTKFRNIDRFLGNLTYPLYLNHVAAGVFVLSFIAPGAWAMGLAFFLAVVLSLGMDRMVEPLSTKWRNTLRGAKLG